MTCSINDKTTNWSFKTQEAYYNLMQCFRNFFSACMRDWMSRILVLILFCMRDRMSRIFWIQYSTLWIECSCLFSREKRGEWTEEGEVTCLLSFQERRENVFFLFKREERRSEWGEEGEVKEDGEVSDRRFRRRRERRRKSERSRFIKIFLVLGVSTHLLRGRQKCLARYLITRLQEAMTLHHRQHDESVLHFGDRGLFLSDIIIFISHQCEFAHDKVGLDVVHGAWVDTTFNCCFAVM